MMKTADGQSVNNNSNNNNNPSATTPQPPSPSTNRQRAPSDSTFFDLLLPGTHDSCCYHINSALVSRSAIPPLRRSAFIRKITANAIADVTITQSLDILGQLMAGVRFLDIRVSKLPPAASPSDDTRFWTVHGMTVCVPLDEIIDQINDFHDTVSKHDQHPPLPTPAETNIPVMSVFRPLDISDAERAELANHIRAKLRGGIFPGTVDELRTTPLAQLPRNIVVGIPELATFPERFGWDIFTDTYSPLKKIKYLLQNIPDSKKQTRDDMVVVGWTVTPQTSDVVKRILGRVFLRRTLKVAALDMDARFSQFAEQNRSLLFKSANVIICDYMDSSFANKVIELNNASLEIADRSSA